MINKHLTCLLLQIHLFYKLKIIMMKILRINFVVAVAALICLSNLQVNAQGGCIEIQSILVDACGTPEGENEMARFDVGNTPLNVANMLVDWPNNPWQGLCQDPSTAAIVTNINNLILGCGSVTEPVNGVLPANSKVLLLTSLNINAILNSFANLNEDLIVLFQCNGNTSGHFANFNLTPGLRTLSIQFTGAGGCTDSVTYDRTMLLNQFGQFGGFTFENDGAFVEFNAAGTPTYLNYGCQVLSTGLALTAGPDAGICPGAAPSAPLNGSGVNIIGNPQWSGGTGTFNPNNAFSTVYTPGAGETGIINLVLTGSGACSLTIADTVRVNIVPSLPSVTITASVSGEFSSNITDSIYFYNWYPAGSTVFIPGAFDPTFSPNANGCYYMILSTVGGCEVISDTICITNVGIEDINETPSVTLYNSPGTDPYLMIESVIPHGKINFAMYDVYGRMIQNTMESINESKSRITPEWNNIANGMYILRLWNNNWSVENKAVIAR